MERARSLPIGARPLAEGLAPFKLINISAGIWYDDVDLENCVCDMARPLNRGQDR